jgi:hypothetical protein
MTVLSYPQSVLNKLFGKRKVIPVSKHRDKKAYRWNEGTAPRDVNLGTVC